VHHGRHFCRTIHAMCNIYALLSQSVIREAEGKDEDEDYTAEFILFHFLELHFLTFLTRERQEHAVFKALLTLIPNFEERIMTGSEDNLAEIANSASFIFIHTSSPF
jgi:hypothetical protein